MSIFAYKSLLVNDLQELSTAEIVAVYDRTGGMQPVERMEMNGWPDLARRLAVIGQRREVIDQEEERPLFSSL